MRSRIGDRDLTPQLNSRLSSAIGKPDFAFGDCFLEFHAPKSPTKVIHHMKIFRKLELEEIFALSYLLLLIVAGVTEWSVHSQAAAVRAQATSYATVGVEGLCCEFIASALHQELKNVPGVVGITPNYQSKTVRLELHQCKRPSAKAIWQAIERSPVRPVRLVLNNESFSERPLE